MCQKYPCNAIDSVKKDPEAPPLRTQQNPWRARLGCDPQHLLIEPSRAQIAQHLAPHAQRHPSGRLVLELGCGSSGFLLQSARAHPQDRFVGLDVRLKRLVRSSEKRRRAGLDNLWIVCLDARQFGRLFLRASVDAVHMHFPDPWPKWRHRSRRMLQGALWRCLAHVLKPGGVFCLKTDYSAICLHALEHSAASPCWTLAAFTNDARRDGHPPDERIATEFEQLFLSQGRPVFALALQRRVLRQFP